jgi:2-C-methyl-D-erythritol 4-phosphate cytidylyltransferase
MKVQVVIPAAGCGQRLKMTTVKAMVLLNQRPLFIRTAEVFERCSLVHSIIIAVPEALLNDFKEEVKKHDIKKITSILPGGKRRCDSVANCLDQLDHDTQRVIVHDAARPFIRDQFLKECIQRSFSNQAVISAVPVKPTIKMVEKERMTITQTLDRDLLWEAQTPQIFDKELLLEAYRSLGRQDPTDDASLVEQLGVVVSIVQGQTENIKITTPEDLALAEVISRSFDSKEKRYDR